MKHAYLIMAHDEFDVLQRLIDAIDDERNDVYVHIDKRIKRFPILHSKYAGLYVLNEKERVCVYWATATQIEAELALFKKAHSQGGYAYYHLISGVHLPLKSQDFLHDFFDSCYDKQVLHLMEDTPKQATDFKLRRYHFLVRYFRRKSRIVCKLSLFLSNLLLFFQKRLGLFRRDKVYAKSENWLSITETAVAHLLENAPRILREYRYTFCSDEYFVATEFSRNPQLFNLRDTPNLLLTDFTGPSPRCYRNEDFEQLVNSNYLFARKFSSRQMELVNRIVQFVKKEE